MVRPVLNTDIPALLEIYNYYIRETVATFEEEELTAELFSTRINRIRESYPYLVYEHEGQILGYAYANLFRERSAYRFTVETSVYVSHESQKGGVGSALYEELIRLIKDQGFHRAIGGITLPNEASERFHEKFGFTKIAHFSEAGRKFNQWHDVGFWELEL